MTCTWWRGKEGPSLLGRDWLTKLTLDWTEMRAISSMNSAKEVEVYTCNRVRSGV